MFKPTIIVLLMTLMSMLSWTQEKTGETKIVKRCPQCQYIEKREVANFCVECGAKLVVIKAIATFTCPDCNKLLDKGAKFCAFCGKPGKLSYQPVGDESYEPGLPQDPKVAKDKVPKPVDQPDSDEEFLPADTKKPETKKPEKENKSIAQLKQLVYPASNLLEEQAIEEGLPHTSQQREILRKVYTCPGTMDAVETFYRSRYPKLAVIKVSHYDILRLLQLKLDLPKHQIEIVFYTFSDARPETWERKHKLVQARLDEEMKPLHDIDKEIAKLDEFCKQGTLTPSQIEERVSDLKRRRSVCANSPSYWNIAMLERVMSLKQNILLITTVVKK